MTTVEASPWARTRRRSLALQASLAVPGFAFACLQSVMPPLLLVTEQRFDSSPHATAWVLTSFLVVSAAATPIGGRLGSLRGNRRVLLWGLSLMVVGLSLSAAAPNLTVMVVGRCLQGASAVLFPLVVVLLREHLPPASVVPAVGFFTASITGGSSAGLVFAGPVVEYLGYAWVFLIPLVLTLVSMTVLVLVVPETATVPAGRMEYRGALLLVAWITAILVAATEGGRWGWTSPATLACGAAALPLLWVWLRSERTSPNPVISWTVLRREGVWQANLTSLFFGATLFGVFAFVPVVLQTPAGPGTVGLGASVAGSGLLTLPMPVCMFLFGACAGAIIDRLGPRLPVIVGAACLVLGFALLAPLHSEPWHFAAACTAFGIGFGLVQSAMIALVMSLVSGHDTGAAVGMNTNIRIVGGTLGVQATLVALNAGTLAGHRSASAFWAALALLLGTAALTLLTSLLLPRRGRAPAPAPTS
ncbi:MFS transporter [Nocardioides humi]|uniref:MFS transporter n=1 Tax=Nocardioides humi TaxID=449461 RepID=A0ABN2BWZ5_9ACTN